MAVPGIGGVHRVCGAWGALKYFNPDDSGVNPGQIKP